MNHKIILFRKFHSLLIEIKTKSLSSDSDWWQDFLDTFRNVLTPLLVTIYVMCPNSSVSGVLCPEKALRTYVTRSIW